MKEKLKQIAQYEQLSIEKFSQKIGVAPSNFYGKNKNSELRIGVFIKILMEFPEISPDWLLLGKGEMLRQGPANADAPVAYVEKLLALTEENSRLKSEIIRLMDDNARLRLGERSSASSPSPVREPSPSASEP